jgi:hypothetical protein
VIVRESAHDSARDGPAFARAAFWLVLRVIGCVAIFAAWMYMEWRNKTAPGIRHASPLFGAFHFVTDSSERNVECGTWLCVFVIPCIFSYPIKPHWCTAMLTLLGLILWLFLGLVGSGIDC